MPHCTAPLPLYRLQYKQSNILAVNKALPRGMKRSMWSVRDYTLHKKLHQVMTPHLGLVTFGVAFVAGFRCLWDAAALPVAADRDCGSCAKLACWHCWQPTQRRKLYHVMVSHAVRAHGLLHHFLHASEPWRLLPLSLLA